MVELWSLVVAVLMLAGNAFFVGAEFGLVSARRSKIEPLALEGSRAARTTLAAMEEVSLMLAGAQLGITVCSVVLGFVSEPVIAHLLEPVFAAMSVPEMLIHPIAFVIALTVTVYLHVVIGEMVPKNLALASPTATALRLTPPLYYMVKLTGPLVISLNWLANHTLLLMGIKPKREVASSFSRDEVAGFVRESHEKGLLSEDEGLLLTGVLMIDVQTAADVMIPIDDVVMTSRDATPKSIESLSVKTGYSRFPVASTNGRYAGYVHIKDIVGVDKATYTARLARAHIRKLNTVKSTDSIKDILATMQDTSSHLARVVSSRGKTVGIVSIEDLVEAVIGQQIIDETDQ